MDKKLLFLGATALLGSVLFGLAKSAKKEEPKDETKRIAIVTGGSIGSIGHSIAEKLSKQPNYTVVITSRTEEQGQKALDSFKEKKINNIEFLKLDISDDESTKTFINEVKQKYKRVDILVNNAGLLGQYGKKFGDVQVEEIDKLFNVNTLGPFKLMQAFIPLMIENKFGRVVNLSSRAGQLTFMFGGHAPYRISKASLNVVTKVAAEEFKQHKFLKINSCCPGFINTNMTRNAMQGNNKALSAAKTIDEGSITPVFLALLPENAPTGKFWADCKIIPF